eukprot:CAMPEP_0170277956 /NCGR_PEP_ID=MMETSP0116_2-20130129/38977_1 /TAXON_ID=400756 /ORGANISM="Durinskia baltica, Strain CSIRO CS-38" /LENGTH=186 /DNA_ID=CAMNT_0010529257 /DNA_START=75 /DNA_END=635 /DNA_ORIENTATION=+
MTGTPSALRQRPILCGTVRGASSDKSLIPGPTSQKEGSHGSFSSDLRLRICIKDDDPGKSMSGVRAWARSTRTSTSVLIRGHGTLDLKRRSACDGLLRMHPPEVPQCVHGVGDVPADDDVVEDLFRNQTAEAGACLCLVAAKQQLEFVRHLRDFEDDRMPTPEEVLHTVDSSDNWRRRPAAFGKPI